MKARSRALAHAVVPHDLGVFRVGLARVVMLVATAAALSCSGRCRTCFRRSGPLLGSSEVVLP